MDFIDDALQTWGRIIGIEDLSFNDNGAVTLRFEQLGSLVVERLESDVLVYLIRQIPQYADDACYRALVLCDYMQGHPYPVTAGLKDETTFLFLARIPEQEFTAQSVETTLQHLVSLHDQLAAE